MVKDNPHNLQMAGAGPCGQSILGSTQISYGVNTATLAPWPVDLGVCCLNSKDTIFFSSALTHLSLTEFHESSLTVNTISILALN